MRITKRALFALFVALALLSSLLPAPAFADEAPASADEADDVVVTVKTENRDLVKMSISTAEEFLAFARDCRNSNYSANLIVDLTADIDLHGAETMPVPSFAGVFYGNGHSIKNFTCAANGSHLGLFRFVEEDGMIISLNVSGEVTPYGSRGSIGGIVGTNRGTVSGCSFSGTVDGLISVGGIVGENLGVVSGCTAEGTVGGQHFTGGIVGYNEGVISRCTNNAQVNIAVRNETTDFSSLDLRDILGIGLVKSTDSDAVSDSGGIVGISTGTVKDCVNRGPVGYQHYGYNIGGIAGRQSGYMLDCVNYGEVLGRQDVGGIVGQMEPFLILDDSARLVDEIDALQNAMAGAMGNMSANSAALGSSAQNVGDVGYNIGYEVYQENSSEAEEQEKQERRENFQEGAQNTGERVGEAYNDLGDDTVSHIVDGNLTDDDYATIGDVGGGLATDGADALSSRIQELEAQRAAEAAQNAQMRAQYSSLASGLNNMGGTLHNTLASLASDMTNVSAHYSNILTMFTNALSGNLQLTVMEDISDLDTDEDMGGKVRACTNHGTVNGDTNTGGVTGSMATESEFDMEGILSSTITDTVTISTDTYFARCIIRKCVNDGLVTGKKDNTGGICGLGELGVISTSENYGDVSSSGNYTGGVVGHSKSMVTESYAMCAVEGSEYVGGVSGQGRRLVGCSTVVELDPTKACSGAISGWVDTSDENTLIQGNVFVSDSLGGIDGISYAGQADAISFEELIKTEELPERFRTLRATFRADGVTVKEISVPYGGSVDPADIPAVPERDNSTGFWPEANLTNLTSSVIVDAVYLDRLTGVAADAQRTDSPLALVIVEGLFEPNDRVSTEDWSEALAVNDREYTLDEALRMHISSQAADSEVYTVHYLSPASKPLQAAKQLYILRDGALERQDYVVDGSYMVFDGTGADLSFCVFTPRYNEPLLIGVGIAAAVVLLLAASALIVRGSRKKKKAAAAAAAGAVEAEVATPAS